MINRSRQRTRVLLVGAGRRIKNNFLPALATLDDMYDVVGITATSNIRLAPLCDQWKIMPIIELSEFDLNLVDLVAVSVPTAANKVVLSQLVDHQDRLTVILDTPVAANRGEMKDVWPVASKFQNIVIAEDYMNFPPFELIRRAVLSGIVGKVTSVTLRNIGYLYHGLALIRSFNKFGKVHFSRRIRRGDHDEIIYRLSDGIRAEVIGPYNRTGDIHVRGTRGGIYYSDAGMNSDRVSDRNLLTVDTNRDVNGLISGFSLMSRERELIDSLETPAFARMFSMDFDDKSDLNLLRGCGLASVFKSVLKPDGLNDEYGLENALYDGVVSRGATRGRLPVDPFSWVGSDIVKVMRAI